MEEIDISMDHINALVIISIRQSALRLPSLVQYSFTWRGMQGMRSLCDSLSHRCAGFLLTSVARERGISKRWLWSGGEKYRAVGRLQEKEVSSLELGGLVSSYASSQQTAYRPGSPSMLAPSSDFRAETVPRHEISGKG